MDEVIALAAVLGGLGFCIWWLLIKKQRLFSRCCFIDLNKETHSLYERAFFYLAFLTLGALVVLCVYLMFLNRDL